MIPPPGADASPAPQDSSPDVADGVRRKLAPAYITARRTARWILAAIVSFGLGGQTLIWLLVRPSRAPVPALLWVAGTAFFVWTAHFWPAIAYRYASYTVSEEGIEIRRGVVWRKVINVPRSRVQHTDVSQGPIERTYDLGTLVIYTAGTDHARVSLPGLPHARALRIRDHLLPAGGEDGV
jgi:membrane protein YdbS with pleckstrin-like domain